MFDQSAEFNNIITDDPRILRTKKSLYRSLCSLLKEKPLSQITISEITKKSKINRSTFYLHYTNLLDLQNEIEENLFRIYKTSLDNYLTSLNLHDNNSGMKNTAILNDRSDSRSTYTKTLFAFTKYKQYAPIYWPNHQIINY